MIITMSVIPPFTYHNLSLYDHKGITDLRFTNVSVPHEWGINMCLPCHIPKHRCLWCAAACHRHLCRLEVLDTR
jgi:hypothetical protein